MIVLDTNVVSELMRPQPNAQVLAWLNAQLPGDLWLTSVGAAELLYGVARLPEGARKRLLAGALADMLTQDFAGRVLSFDLDAAGAYAELLVSRELRGRPVAAADAQIAAICRAQGAALATRNQRDFEDVGLVLINPWA